MNLRQMDLLSENVQKRTNSIQSRSSILFSNNARRNHAILRHDSRSGVHSMKSLIILAAVVACLLTSCGEVNSNETNDIVFYHSGPLNCLSADKISLRDLVAAMIYANPNTHSVEESYKQADTFPEGRSQYLERGRK